MTDQPPREPEPATADASAEAHDDSTTIGLITDGAYALLIARFPSTDEAQAAYADLQELERRTSLRIDVVVVAHRDHEGKMHLGTVTEHSTRSGLTWGVVGGVALGLIFPPSILAGAAAGGAVGAAIGKVNNLAHRSALRERVEAVLTPDSSGLVALVEDSAVVAIREALAKADRIVTEAVDAEAAAAIDREAASAKEALRH